MRLGIKIYTAVTVLASLGLGGVWLVAGDGHSERIEVVALSHVAIADEFFLRFSQKAKYHSDQADAREIERNKLELRQGEDVLCSTQ